MVGGGYKASLDIFRLKDESLSDSDNLPPPGHGRATRRDEAAATRMLLERQRSLHNQQRTGLIVSAAVPMNLANLLFGAYRRDALALLLLHPEDALHVREIARITGKAPGTLLRELNRLADAGILLRRPVGNQVQYQANVECPIFDDLRSILKKTAGLADVLRAALDALGGRIRVAFVFGSVARGDETAGSDVDVMVVGTAKFADLVMALAPAQEALRRTINPNAYSADEFADKVASGEPFLRRVLADPKLLLIGTDRDLGELAANRQAQGARRRKDRGSAPVKRGRAGARGRRDRRA